MKKAKPIRFVANWSPDQAKLDLGRWLVKWFWSKFRIGILALIPIFVITFCVGWVVQTIINASFSFVDNKILNFFINAGLLFVAICLLGWFVSMRWFRSLILAICSKVPFLSSVTNFFLSHDYIEQIKSGELSMMPEVLVCLDGKDDWALGIVMNKIKLPENLWDKSSTLVDWCVVLSPPTPPLSFTSQKRLRKESLLIYTGRTGKESASSVATFGLNLRLDSSKFVIKKPPVS